jgi:hypothetical protein
MTRTGEIVELDVIGLTSLIRLSLVQPHPSSTTTHYDLSKRLSSSKTPALNN